MNPIVHRLVVLGLEEKDAEALVKAGLDTPRKIKAASDKDLPKGIGKTAVRARFPKRKG
jgi:hypothetical protein